MVREAQEIERLWPPFAPSPTVRRSEPSEFDQPRLVFVQAKLELGQPFRQSCRHPVRIRAPLEGQQEVVGVARQPHLAGSAIKAASARAMRFISWPNTDPAHSLSTLSPERCRPGPKTRCEASAAELPRWSFHPLEIMSFSCRTLILSLVSIRDRGVDCDAALSIACLFRRAPACRSSSTLSARARSSPQACSSPTSWACAPRRPCSITSTAAPAGRSGREDLCVARDRPCVKIGRPLWADSGPTASPGNGRYPPALLPLKGLMHPLSLDHRPQIESSQSVP